MLASLPSIFDMMLKVVVMNRGLYVVQVPGMICGPLCGYACVVTGYVRVLAQAVVL